MCFNADFHHGKPCNETGCTGFLIDTPVQPVVDIFLLYTFVVFERGKNTYVSTI